MILITSCFGAVSFLRKLDKLVEYEIAHPWWLQFGRSICPIVIQRKNSVNLNLPGHPQNCDKTADLSAKISKYHLENDSFNIF